MKNTRYAAREGGAPLRQAAEPELRRTRLAYVGGCFLVLFYDRARVLSFLRPLVGG